MPKLNEDEKRGAGLAAAGCLLVLLAVGIQVAVVAGLSWLLTRFVITEIWDVPFNPAWIGSAVVLYILFWLFGRKR